MHLFSSMGVGFATAQACPRVHPSTPHVYRSEIDGWEDRSPFERFQFLINECRVPGAALFHEGRLYGVTPVWEADPSFRILYEEECVSIDSAHPPPIKAR